jgi:hypothetical protein
VRRIGVHRVGELSFAFEIRLRRIGGCHQYNRSAWNSLICFPRAENQFIIDKATRSHPWQC